MKQMSKQESILYKEARLPKDTPEHWREYIQTLAEIVANRR